MLTVHGLPTGHRARLAEHSSQQRQLARGTAPSLVQRLGVDSRLLCGAPSSARVGRNLVSVRTKGTRSDLTESCLLVKGVP